MDSYINSNTLQRDLCKMFGGQVGNKMFELMNNVTFGETYEYVRKRSNIECMLSDNTTRFEKVVAMPILKS